MAVIPQVVWIDRDIQRDTPMATYSAIAETSEALIELLRDEFTERRDVINVGRNEIALVSPAEIGADSDVRLSLYLYSITENSVLNNAERRQVGDDTLQDPPQALDLSYLLTAFPSTGGNDETAGTVDQQRVLGLAVQILNDNAVIDAEDVVGTAERDIQISMIQESREVMDIWTTFGDTPYHPSIAYRVSPVLIDSRVEREVSRVVERQLDYERQGAGE